jgi:2-oxoglutarate ferredoxin oxidoreductase subunit beta
MNNKKLISCADRLCDLGVEWKSTWCGNCGNYGIQSALNRALVLEDIAVDDAVLCYDVGCSGNGSDKVDMFTIHGLHGRVLPLAAGVKIANPRLKVIASAGDGATMSEGVNHLVHAVRNDYPILFILHNNENYGLTTGQASATTRKGLERTASEYGTVVDELNVCDFVLSLKPSFVARTYSGRVEHMTEIIRKGLSHKGFAFIEVMQACPTYNKETPDEWYEQRFTDVSKLEGYDSKDIWAARKIAEDMDIDIAMGVLYENPKKTDFISASEIEGLKFWGRDLTVEVGKTKVDINKFL